MKNYEPKPLFESEMKSDFLSLLNKHTTEVKKENKNIFEDKYKATFMPPNLKESEDTGLSIKQLLVMKGFENPLSIINYGADVVSRSARTGEQIIKEASNSDTKEINEKIVSVLSLAKGIDFNEKQSGFFNKVVNFVRNSKENIVGKFTSLESKIDSIMKEISDRLANAEHRIVLYDKMYEDNRKEIFELEELISDLKIVLEKKKDDLNELSRTSKAIDIVSLSDQVEMIERRLLNLESIKIGATQTAPMILMARKNAIKSIEKFRTLQELVIPNWKKNIGLYIQMSKDQNDADVSNSIDDVNNESMRNIADALGDSSIKTSKASNRSSIDIETIKYVHESMINTFDQLLQIDKDASIERKNNLDTISELNRLYENMGKYNGKFV